MPELPEAETVARQLREQLTGAVIMDCWIGREDIIRDGFSCLGWYHGARLITASRLGKCVILHAEKASETRFLIFERLFGYSRPLLLPPLAHPPL